MCSRAIQHGMTKDFDGWIEKKKKLDAQAKPPFFNEGQVWWCSIGVNVGYEIYGKSHIYTRPVLVLRKYSRQTFFGLPLTTQRKNRTAYHTLQFRGNLGAVILDQGRTLDSRRLIERIGELSESTMKGISLAFKDYH
jgi:mRNA interferase MazF